ncbi:unnamed protein product, partial [Coregonus sp. 'balchen']
GEEIRLVNGTSRCSGQANEVFGQLGCGRAVSAQGTAHVGQGSGGRPTWLDDVGCDGSESSLTECSHGGLKHHDGLQVQDASVVCSVKPNIRLVNGSDLCSGRVEVYQIGQWLTVCDDVWDLNDAAVVCRQLGCGRADSAPETAYFGQGSGPIWQDDVGCSGSECSITQCPHTGGGTHECNHGNDAGVICSASIVPIIVSGGTGGVALLFLLLLVICLVSWRTRRNRKPSTETDQRECIDNRHNRGEENEEEEEEEEDYVNVENVFYERGLERVTGEKKNGKGKGHSYGKSEDVYDNEEGNIQRK